MNADGSPPSWPELMIWMCFGESEEAPFSGIVEVDDRYGDGDGDGDDGDGDQPTLPRTVRVHKRGALYRVETLDGDLLFIKGSDGYWRFTPGQRLPSMITDPDQGEGRGSYAYAIARPHPTRWQGDDFTTPTGPPRPTTYLGRDAWEIEIAPPPHKPAPITLTVDRATGMQLRWHSERFGSDVFRWTELDTDVSLDDALFTWEGAYIAAVVFAWDEMPDEMRESIERSEAEQAARWRGLGVPDLSISLDSAPVTFHVEDDGSFHVSYDFEAFLTVARRPHSTGPWDDDLDERGMTWTEGAWDWVAHFSHGGGPDQLAHIRRQLSEPRPEDD